MSLRALKKLAKSKDSEEMEEEDDNVPQKHSVFSLIDLAEPEAVEAPSDLQDEPRSSHPVNKKKKKKNNKLKKQPKPAVNNAKDDDDALLEQAHHLASTSSEPPQCEANVSDLLSINRKCLDYLAELQRKFGSGTVGQLVAKEVRTSAFGQIVRPKPTWTPFIKCGLDMQRREGEECGFSFVHSKDYARQQRAFYVLQDMADPNTLSMILSKSPYHVDTLLQLSEALMHQDQSDVGVDLLERALYAFQSAFHMSFNFTSVSNCYLDYRVQENRSLFIALFRYIFYVASRGCFRSALEYSKMLLLLDPEKDPLAITLAIDFFAIASEEYEFLIDFYDILNNKRNLGLLPNFAFSMPMVRWLQRNRPRRKKTAKNLLEPAEIDKMLQDALIMFPGFLPRLMKHTRVGGTNNLDKSVLFGKEVRLSESEVLGRLLDVYLSQAHYYWQEPDLLAWLESNVEAVLQLVEPAQFNNEHHGSTHAHPRHPDPRLAEYSEKRKRLYSKPPRSILRHILLRDLPDARPLVPPAFANQQIYPLDPFPPPDSINSYDPEAERRSRQNAAGGTTGFLNTLLASLWPTVPSRQEDVVNINNILADFGLQVVVEAEEEEDGNANPQNIDEVD